jgi:hypothetical protein
MTQLPLNGVPLGFEDTLWDMADPMRGPMDPAESVHVRPSRGRLPCPPAPNVVS